MEKMKMQSENLVDENVEKISKLFPNCITEGKDENGNVVRAVDFDLLKQELSKNLVEGNDERYTLNWAGKKQSILTANSPINATLRPYESESVGKDGTSGGWDSQNLYIEGDNLDVLKLLRETYLNKIKMIYIDPPYNTGNDFVYNDDFASSADEYLQNSKSYDEDGNRMVQNLESNGRFHSDWLSMIYPRLKLARDLLTDDGVIFISIDDNEQANLKKICDEIFGEQNFIAEIIRNTNSSKNQSLFVSVSHEYCIIYAKNIENLKTKHAENKWHVPKNNIKEYLKKVEQLKKEGLNNETITEELKTLTKYPRFIDFTNYWYFDERGLYRKDNLGGVKNGNYTPIFNPLTNRFDDVPPGGFRYNKEKMQELIKDNRIHFHTDGSLPVLKRYLSENEEQRPKSIMSDDQRPDYALMQEFNTPFDNPKQLSFIKRITSLCDNNSIILDFFSGSATTAHAVMQLNAEDGGNRKFIMVQLPEICDEKSEAYKAGYKNICEIGKERIRRAGKKIVEEIKNASITFGKNRKDVKEMSADERKSFDKAINMASEKLNQEDGLKNLEDFMNQADKTIPDIGFRVLKLDSSNMKDVYYTPAETPQGSLLDLVSNIKEDRSPEDLLFQVMLDMGVMLDSKIEKIELSASKQAFNVNDGNLICCFDINLSEDDVTKIAKMQPLYAVFRDSSMSSDSVAVNFDQIFETCSPSTTRKVL